MVTVWAKDARGSPAIWIYSDVDSLAGEDKKNVLAKECLLVRK